MASKTRRQQRAAPRHARTVDVAGDQGARHAQPVQEPRQLQHPRHQLHALQRRRLDVRNLDVRARLQSAVRCQVRGRRRWGQAARRRCERCCCCREHARPCRRARARLLLWREPRNEVQNVSGNALHAAHGCHAAPHVLHAAAGLGGVIKQSRDAARAAWRPAAAGPERGRPPAAPCCCLCSVRLLLTTKSITGTVSVPSMSGRGDRKGSSGSTSAQQCAGATHRIALLPLWQQRLQQ